MTTAACDPNDDANSQNYVAVSGGVQDTDSGTDMTTNDAQVAVAASLPDAWTGHLTSRSPSARMGGSSSSAHRSARTTTSLSGRCASGVGLRRQRAGSRQLDRATRRGGRPPACSRRQGRGFLCGASGSRFEQRCTAARMGGATHGDRNRDRGHARGFRIEQLLGRGAMGAVYLAEDVHLRRKAALKVLAPSSPSDERFRQRFLLESQLAASLEHPHIVPIYAAGEEERRALPRDEVRRGLRPSGAYRRDRPGRRRAARSGCWRQVADALDARTGSGSCTAT